MKIINKKILKDTQSTRIIKLEIHAPLIAEKAKPGQFVVLIVNEKGERAPLTIVEADRASGTITLIFQEVGLTTKLLGKMNPGDSLYALTGPLGRPTEIKNYGKVILAGGGVGIAEIYPVAKAMKEAGNYVVTVIGGRTKDLLILEEELGKVSDELHIATDDGSYGRKGFTTDILGELLAGKLSLRAPRSGAKQSQANGIASSLPSVAPRNDRVGLVYAVGPIPMMRKVSEVSKKFNVKALVSLNALMVDATGMCGSCRVTIGGEVKFSCVDGPEFDAHAVDWEELENRNKIYCEKERHVCRLEVD